MTQAPHFTAQSEPLIERLRRATIGRYDIYAELGSGGMASVFLALDLALDRKVAIKVLSPNLSSAPDNLTRFGREAKVAAALDHPNIIGILAVGDDPGLAYFVMKFVEGSTLDAVIAMEGAQSVSFARSVLSTAARALHYAHVRGVVHRDVKPANLMLDLEGRLIITDFGIAKMEDAQGLTITGSVIGTPYYMSPEQFNGLPVTGATDQYALGVVAFELLTGLQPYRGRTVGEVMRGHLFDPIPSVRSEKPDVPEDLDAAVTRMLAKNPEDRFPTLEDAARAIEVASWQDEALVRTQIIELARSGARKLPAIHVPVSPTPAVRTRPRDKEVVVYAPRRRRVLLALVLLAVGLGAFGATAALRPDLLGLSGAEDTTADSASLAPRLLTEPAPDSAGAGVATLPEPAPTPARPSAPRKAPTVSVPSSAESQTSSAPIATGLVIVGSNIPLSVLYVNDAAVSAARGVQRLNLPAGNVKLSIRSRRCATWDTTFTVVAGTQHRIGLRPADC